MTEVKVVKFNCEDSIGVVPLAKVFIDDVEIFSYEPFEQTWGEIQEHYVEGFVEGYTYGKLSISMDQVRISYEDTTLSKDKGSEYGC